MLEMIVLNLLLQLRVPKYLASLINLAHQSVHYRGKKELYEYLVSDVSAKTVSSDLLKLEVTLKRLTCYYWFTVFMPRLVT